MPVPKIPKIPRGLIRSGARTGVRTITHPTIVPGIGSQYRTLGNLWNLGRSGVSYSFPLPPSMIPQQPAVSLNAVPQIISQGRQYIVPLVSPASNDAIRTLYREHVGFPTRTTDPFDLSLDETRAALEYPARNGISSVDQSLFNLGVDSRQPEYINYPGYINDAVDHLYTHRLSTPYTSMDEYNGEQDMFYLRRWNAPVEATTPIVEQSLLNGTPLPYALERVGQRAALDLFNTGRLPESHPLIQERLQDFISDLTDNSRKINEVYASVVRGETGSERAEDAFWDLQPHISRQLTNRELVDFFHKAMPPKVDANGEFVKKLDADGNPIMTRGSNGQMEYVYEKVPIGQLTDSQKQHFRSLLRSYPIVSERIDRSILPKLRDYSLMSPQERTDLVPIINSSYIRPWLSSDPLTPYQELQQRTLIDHIKKTFGIETTPEEYRTLFDPTHPNYIPIATKFRDAGYSILPADATHLSWFGVRNALRNAKRFNLDLPSPVFDNFTPAQKEYMQKESKKLVKDLLESQAKLRTGSQALMLQNAIPRRVAVAEEDTSVDSLNLLASTAASVNPKDYGSAPGQIMMKTMPTKGIFKRDYGNKFHLNRIRYSPEGKIVSDLGIPGIEGAFTSDEVENMLSALRGVSYLDLPNEILAHPEYQDLISRVLNVARAVNNRDVTTVGQTYRKLNKMHSERGLNPVKGVSATTLPTGPGETPAPGDFPFEHPSNLEDILNLIRDIHGSSKSTSGEGGWNSFLKRDGFNIVERQKQGGAIPKWTKRFIK